ncbi:MAG: energy transducer TonB [Bacteroidota bacterium]|jgi:TonB family protein
MFHFRLILLLLFFIGFSKGLKAQSPVDQLPSYPGKEDALVNYIQKNMRLNDENKLQEGTIQLSFDVHPDSSVSGVIIIEGLHPSVDEQVVKLMEKARFIPAIKEGKPVKMNMMTEILLRGKQ